MSDRMTTTLITALAEVLIEPPGRLTEVARAKLERLRRRNAPTAKETTR